MALNFSPKLRCFRYLKKTILDIKKHVRISDIQNSNSEYQK